MKQSSYQDYFHFLGAVFTKVQSNLGPTSIYPLLQNNLDKLDENLVLVLQALARDILGKLTLEEAHHIAAVINNFSTLICQFPQGNKYWNVEIAITGHQTALQVYTETAFPQNWAMTQYNLANAYRERIKGDKAENLELAIASYKAALRVYTETAFPQAWAMTKIIWLLLIAIESKETRQRIWN